MTTIDQIMGGGQLEETRPLRSTTLGPQSSGIDNDSAYNFALQRLKEQEGFLRTVGLPDNTRVTGAPAIYDTKSRDEEYEKEKLAWMKRMLFQRKIGGFPIGGRG